MYSNYKNQFITLANLKVESIPDSIEIEGQKFIVKSEFHITLLAVRRIAEIIDTHNAEKLQIEIVHFFNEFAEKSPLNTYELLHEIRLVTVGENMTVVVMAKLEGIERLFTALEEKYHVKLPVQPTHITLYTLPSDTFGIPILSYDELENISRPLEVTELNFDMIK